MSAQVKQRQNGVVDTILVNEHAKTPLRNPPQAQHISRGGMTDRLAVDTLRYSSEGYAISALGGNQVSERSLHASVSRPQSGALDLHEQIGVDRGQRKIQGDAVSAAESDDLHHLIQIATPALGHARIQGRKSGETRSVLRILLAKEHLVAIGAHQFPEALTQRSEHGEDPPFDRSEHGAILTGMSE